MLHFAVIGHPINHSLSPIIHTQFAEQYGISLTYETINTTPNHFINTVHQFFKTGQGLNITVPFKQAAFQLASQCSDRARMAQSANVLWKNEADQICADNTDGFGFIEDLNYQNELYCLKNAEILILGAGGAVQGILPDILNQVPKQVVIVNRTLAKAERLITQFNHDTLRVKQTHQLHTPYDLIIHSTSATLSNQLPDIPKQAINQQTVVYDLSYGMSAQLFKMHAEQLGVKQFVDGLGMLVEQAAESFFIWHHVRPKTRTVLSQLHNTVKKAIS
ncbi:MAG: shikimate dehydrogenase [Endozoicomonadaceae bacterium]|nr:shikimate dehydrogenase [Endozoicomonadaceae bacterium]